MTACSAKSISRPSSPGSHGRQKGCALLPLVTGLMYTYGMRPQYRRSPSIEVTLALARCQTSGRLPGRPMESRSLQLVVVWDSTKLSIFGMPAQARSSNVMMLAMACCPILPSPLSPGLLMEDILLLPVGTRPFGYGIQRQDAVSRRIAQDGQAILPGPPIADTLLQHTLTTQSASGIW